MNVDALLRCALDLLVVPLVHHLKVVAQVVYRRGRQPGMVLEGRSQEALQTADT